MENLLDQYLKAYQGETQYEFDNEILLNWYPRRILDNTRGSISLLELGLGHGYSTFIFGSYFKKHIVIEGSGAIIQNFKNKYPECSATIIQTYFEAFNSDEKFDVIVMGFILEHVDDPVKILLHFKKFLNSNGKLYVAVPNAEVLNRRLGHMAGLLTDLQVLSNNDHLLGHQRYYTVSSLTADIKKAGYDIVKMEGIYLKPFTTNQILSLNLNKKILDALCKIGIDYPELSCGILAELKSF